jgi:UDP-N-acetyl-2-amino-2-deoxyglucuronate dehydrogenase
MNKVNFAVVGCGNIGKRHAAVIDADLNAELVGICDVNEATCKDISTSYNNIPYYLDYRQLLEKIDADFINICTPHHLHKEMAIAAANAGKHILVEKPMALYLKDCNEMIEAARRNNVKLYVVKQNRFNRPILVTKNALLGGKLGKIFIVQCNVLWNRYQGYYDESDWRGKRACEGGALYTQVSHFIDLLIWFFGDINKSQTILELRNHTIEIEDCGSSIIHFENGIIGSLNWTTCVYNKNYEGSITIIGENGTIKIGGQYLNKIEYWDVKTLPLDTSIEYTDKPNLYNKYQGTSSNHPYVIEHVIKAFQKQGGDVVEGEEGAKTIEAINLIYKNTFLEQ